MLHCDHWSRARVMRIPLTKFEQDHGYWKHHNGHKYCGDRRRQHGARAIDRLQYGQGDEACIGHRCRHAMHGSACETSGSTNAHDAEHENEAEEGSTTKSNKKAPIDQRMTWFLRNGDDQQRRHCDVVGEVNQAVRQRPRQIARVPNDPASQDHCKHRKDKVSDPHRGCLRVTL